MSLFTPFKAAFAENETGQNVYILNSEVFQELKYPKMKFPSKTDSRETKDEIKAANELFQRYESEIENSEIELRRNGKPSDKIYYYEIKSEDISSNQNTFNILRSGFNQLQGTFITINSISDQKSLSKGKKIFLPVSQGIFVNQKPETAIEILIASRFSEKISEKTCQFWIDDKKYYFFPKENFTGTEIAYFHDDTMILPLPKKVLTSEFGYRTSPISGKWSLHAGIDLAASTGTEVYACKSGTVIQADYNSIYGNFIILQHNDKKTSTYAHLSKINVKNGEKVGTGQKIGLVGTTGASTGPHLHFEVRENGKPINPLDLVR